MSDIWPDLQNSPARLQNLLERHQLAAPGEQINLYPLTGGVSSAIYRVTLDSGTYCIKQALAKLKVKKDWSAPTDRAFAEIAWLQTAGRIVPGHVPQIRAVDREACAFIMDLLPDTEYPNWKSLLLAGIVDPASGKQAADILGRIHAATAADEEIPANFANHGNFYQLRLEPYLVETARINPDLSDQLLGLVYSLQHHRRVLVHGDVSPKNILLGPMGPVFLDAECACFGDPAFDLAFLLNHILLKSALHPERQEDLAALFLVLATTYLAHVNWEPAVDVEKRVVHLLPGLLLARVDGKSPVEYLTAPQQSFVRHTARHMLRNPVDRLAALLDVWISEILRV